MRDAALQERRNRQILADIVRTYIETGEPVSSRAVSQRFQETLSSATIRTVMADLEDGGLLFQPHTSAGRVPTAAAYRFFAQEIASRATLSIEDRDWIKSEFNAASSSAEMTARARHVLGGDDRACRPRAGRSFQWIGHYRVSAFGENRSGARQDVAIA